MPRMTSCPLGNESVACSAGLAISPNPLSVVPSEDRMRNVCAAVGGMLSRLTATLPASAAVSETTIWSDVPATASTSTAKTPVPVCTSSSPSTVVSMVPRPPGAMTPSLVTRPACTDAPELNSAPAWLMNELRAASVGQTYVAGDRCRSSRPCCWLRSFRSQSRPRPRSAVIVPQFNSVVALAKTHHSRRNTDRRRRYRGSSQRCRRNRRRRCRPSRCRSRRCRRC